MRRSWRIAAIAGGIVAVGVATLAIRTFMIAGVFTTVTPHFSGACKAIYGVIGAEDIAADRQDGLVFLSASDRRPDHPARSRDGLYTLALAHPELGVTRLSGTPKDFHPLGIALYRAQNGLLTLMAVNIRRHGQPSIDIFDVTIAKAGDASASATLRERTSIRSSVIVHPNDVAATGPNSFYVTNDHSSRSKHGNFFETVLALPLGNIVYYNGAYPHVAATGLRFANGLALSGDGTKLYAAETLGRDIRTYDVQPVTGKLIAAGSISLPAAPDNISRDAEGQLWVAAHPRLLAFLAYAKNPKRPSPSEIFRVTTIGGEPTAATRIYAGLGDRIGASSVGVYAGGHLFIGSVFDDKILACTLH
jgi:arylesterase/paraoxonase